MKENSQAALRRSTRIQVRIPVTISGKLADGKPFREETHIATVSKFGAKLKTKLPVTQGLEITVKPRLRKESTLFRVKWVGRPGTAREGEAGIEYVTVSNLLGVSFP